MIVKVIAITVIVIKSDDYKSNSYKSKFHLEEVRWMHRAKVHF